MNSFCEDPWVKTSYWSKMLTFSRNEQNIQKGNSNSKKEQKNKQTNSNDKLNLIKTPNDADYNLFA